MGIFNKKEQTIVPKMKLKKRVVRTKAVAPVEEIEEEVEELEDEEVPVVATRRKVTDQSNSVKRLAKPVEPEIEENHEWEVVREIPTQKIGQYTKEDGTVLHFITIEQALTQIMNRLEEQ